MPRAAVGPRQILVRVGLQAGAARRGTPVAERSRRPGGSARGGGTGGGVGDLPGTSAFTRFTLRRVEGPESFTVDCPDGFVSEWSYERATRTLSYDFCLRPEGTKYPIRSSTSSIWPAET